MESSETAYINGVIFNRGSCVVAFTAASPDEVQNPAGKAVLSVHATRLTLSDTVVLGGSLIKKLK
jgi:hypothetical protein